MDNPIDSDAVRQEVPALPDVGLPAVEDVELEPQDETAEFDQLDPSQEKASVRKRRSLMCFNCNRSEGHFLYSGQRWFFSFLLGMTFGGILLIGPYKCQCCGSNRLMAFDLLNPRCWMHGRRDRKIRKYKRRSRTKRKL